MPKSVKKYLNGTCQLFIQIIEVLVRFDKQLTNELFIVLTPAVNFINVKRANFLYKSLFLAAFLVTFWL